MSALDHALISLLLKKKLWKQLYSLVRRVKKMKKEDVAVCAATDATAETMKAKEAGQEIVVAKFETETRP